MPAWVLDRMDTTGTISNKQTTWEPLLTPTDAAAYLRVHPEIAIRLARTKRLPAIRIGKHWRFRHSDLTAWAAEQVQYPCQPVE